MSTSTSQRRKSRSSLFGLNRTPSPLSPLTTTESDLSTSEKQDPKLLRKKSPSSRLSSPFGYLTPVKRDKSPRSPENSGDDFTALPSLSTSSLQQPSSPSQNDSPKNSLGSRPSMGRRPNRPSSVFGSLKSLRFANDDDSPPSTANSVTAKSPTSAGKELGGRDELTDIGRNKTLLHHGEVQTSSGWLFRRKEYLVLTETHLIRYKNFAKATENFPALITLRREPVRRHTSSQSVESIQESMSAASNASGEKANAVALEQVVAVYLNDDRPFQSLEMSYIDSETGQGSSLTLGLADAGDRDTWLQYLRLASNQARLYDAEPMSQAVIEYAARIVEREEDYDVQNFQIYKVVNHSMRSNGRLSADESNKASPTICLFVIGAHKVHFINLPRSALRGSTPSLADLGERYNHGILTLTWISVSKSDDTFCLTFRFPFKRPRAYQLSSLAAVEIARQLRRRDRALRPEWTHRSFGYNAPSPFEDDGPRSNQGKELGGWADALTAFCVAYGVSPSIVRYAVEYEAEDAPHFILYPPDRQNNPFYSTLELLAILRSLRYNESFGSICFAASLDVLNDGYDPHGSEFASHYQKNGNPVGISIEDQERSSVLVAELRALATSNPKLRRVDFSGSIVENVLSSADPERAPRGSGMVEALYPICRKQSTNVDWFAFNYIPLTELDIEYLTGLAAAKACHVRGIELSGCSLTDQNLGLILDTLKAQANTLEAIDISRNPVKLNPFLLGRSLEEFNFIRRLDLSDLGVSSTSDPLLDFKILQRWRLEDLRLSGTQLNDESVKSLCSYLEHRQSEVLKTLTLSGCALNGARAADIMEAMAPRTGEARFLALDLSDNRLASGHERLVGAIARSLAPSHLAIRALEYDTDDEKLAEMLFALAANKSIRTLDISRISLAAEVSKLATVALKELLQNNQTLTDLDIGGEKSRLEHAHLGKGMLEALSGLKDNTSLQVLRIQHQKLGLQGASVLADVMRENAMLREIHCDNNNISLSGFTDMINALASNHHILYLPALQEGRVSQLEDTENQIRAARTRSDGTVITPSTKISGMRKTFARMSGAEPSASTSIRSVPQWTQQDVQAALRLVTESWEGQVDRLNTFLQRNARIANGASLNEADMSHTEAQRPDTASSMSKLLNKISKDRTPREEAQVEPWAGGTTETTAPSVGEGEGSEGSVSSESLPMLLPPQAAASGLGLAHSVSTLAPPSLVFASTPSLGLHDFDIDRTPVFECTDPFDLMPATNGPYGAVGQDTIKTSTTSDESSNASSADKGLVLDHLEIRHEHHAMYENLPPPHPTPPKD